MSLCLTQRSAHSLSTRWVCNCVLLSHIRHMDNSRVASRNEGKGNARLTNEALNADCGFALRPKFAATGIFTQIEAIVHIARKTHIDTNNSHNDIF